MDSIDERIAQLNQLLDGLRNKDFVQEIHWHRHYKAIEDAERELLALLKQKGKQ